MAEEQKNTITVDGKEYSAENLSEQAKNLVTNVQATDQELNRLRVQNAIAQTARQVYVNALKAELEENNKE